MHTKEPYARRREGKAVAPGKEKEVCAGESSTGDPGVGGQGKEKLTITSLTGGEHRAGEGREGSEGRKGTK